MFPIAFTNAVFRFQYVNSINGDLYNSVDVAHTRRARFIDMQLLQRGQVGISQITINPVPFRLNSQIYLSTFYYICWSRMDQRDSALTKIEEEQGSHRHKINIDGQISPIKLVE